MADRTFAAMPAATGALRNAPLGTPGPTKADSALDAAWLDLGFIGEDGFTESNSRTTDKKRALGGSTVRVLQTEYGVTVQFTFLDSMDLNVLKRVYGADNVSVDGDGNVTVKRNKKPLPHESWVIDLFDGDKIDRSYIPDGQITEVGDVVKVHSDVVMFTVTIEAFENEDGDNIIGYLYSEEFADNGSDDEEDTENP